MLPLEVFVEIARMADNKTAGSLRLVCRTYRDAFNAYKSLPWHAEMLQEKLFGASGNFWQAISYLQAHASVVQATPSGAAPFPLQMSGVLLALEHLRLIDSTLRNIKVGILPPAVGALQNLTCITALNIHKQFGGEHSVVRLPNLPNLKSLRVADNASIQIPTGLTSLEISCKHWSPRISPEAALTLRHLQLDGFAGIWCREDLTAIMDNAPHLSHLQIYTRGSEQLLCEKWRKYTQLRQLSLGEAKWTGEELPLPKSLETLHISMWPYASLKRSARLDLSVYENILRLELQNMRLRAIGRIIWPSRLRHLDLRSNEITSLRGARFPSTLRTIDLTNNYTCRQVQVPGCKVII